MTLKRFTISELKEFDGKQGRPAYSAFNGKVYDVSNSPLWKNGKHAGVHSAGVDLTVSMLNAPHGEELLTKYPLVGEVVQEDSFKQKLTQEYIRHLHPIMVHFSVAYPILVPVLSILYGFTGETSFEMASYYVLVLGFLAAPIGGLSGIYSWRVTYEGRITKAFSRKIIYTFTLIAVISVCFVWRTLNPSILITITDLSYIYLGLVVSLVPISTILGYYGGKIVYSY
jgi:predicted heme/steroid binding protein/uncharacterized membrane protein